ncbi:hypothetical protein BD769DRAFT_1351324 [Suillus cothurnatus]|nr:hypothetical protein BD769DRAFT_1351324 [Suillus cothurnatus]
MFPWPSKAICCQLSCIPYADISFQHFITALLFSSTRLLFSEAQKKAILSWAKELGARDVPLLYALNCSQETIQKLVSDPTERSLLVWQTYSISIMLEKWLPRYVLSCTLMRLSHTDFNPSIEDYANPLTCFVMQDYLEDGGKGMSEVFNGEKILFELPSPLAAKVDGEIYFINELLQDDILFTRSHCLIL